jgi:transcriptional regulator with PAS, ATPase and Fis domain
VVGVLKIGRNTIINLDCAEVVEFMTDRLLQITMSSGKVYQFKNGEDADFTKDQLIEQIFQAINNNEGLRLENLKEGNQITEDDGTKTQYLPQLDEYRRIAVEKAEKLYLTEVLTQTKGRIDATAEFAGISTRQLHNLMTKYELNKDNFKQGDRLLWGDCPD